MEADKVETDKRIDERLAIDGGKPVRIEPIPPEFPGVHYYDEKELE